MAESSLTQVELGLYLLMEDSWIIESKIMENEHQQAKIGNYESIYS